MLVDASQVIEKNNDNNQVASVFVCPVPHKRNENVMDVHKIKWRDNHGER